MSLLCPRHVVRVISVLGAGAQLPFYPESSALSAGHAPALSQVTPAPAPVSLLDLLVRPLCGWLSNFPSSSALPFLGLFALFYGRFPQVVSQLPHWVLNVSGDTFIFLDLRSRISDLGSRSCPAGSVT